MKILYSDWGQNGKELCAVCGKTVGFHDPVMQKTGGKYIVRARICFDHVDGTTTPWTLDEGTQQVEVAVNNIAQALETLEEQLQSSETSMNNHNAPEHKCNTHTKPRGSKPKMIAEEEQK